MRSFRGAWAAYMSGFQPFRFVFNRYLGLRPRLVYVGPSALFQQPLSVLGFVSRRYWDTDAFGGSFVYIGLGL